MRRVTGRVSRNALCLLTRAALFTTSPPLRSDDSSPPPHQRPPRHRTRGPNASATSGGPVKDRFPPIATDLSDARRRLALLVDASSVDVRGFHRTILPAACKVGVPVLVRLFAMQLSPEWEAVLTRGEAKRQENPTEEAKAEKERENGESIEGVPRCAVEFFRVERFIPVSMQMEADATHIFDFRRQNKVEAVCFVCSEVDRSVFEGFLGNVAGNGFNQYVLDELGMAKEVLEDERSADGTPTSK